MAPRAGVGPGGLPDRDKLAISEDALTFMDFEAHAANNRRDEIVGLQRVPTHDPAHHAENLVRCKGTRIPFNVTEQRGDLAALDLRNRPPAELRKHMALKQRATILERPVLCAALAIAEKFLG